MLFGAVGPCGSWLSTPAEGLCPFGVRRHPRLPADLMQSSRAAHLVFIQGFPVLAMFCL